MTKTVEHLKPGDLVDLESCPYMHDHPTAEFEYAQVAAVTRETENCVAVLYEGIDLVGYPVGTRLEVA